MKKEDKAVIIKELSEAVQKYPHLYLVDAGTMNSVATSELRRACFEAGVTMRVVKNNLLHKAFESAEFDYSPFYDSLKGYTAVLFSEVANTPAKLIKKYAKNGVPALKAAYAEESFYIGEEHLEALVGIKSKEEVIAEVIALLQSPAKNVISALQSGGNTIHGVLKTLSERE